MPLSTINEGSTGYLTIAFKDNAGVAVVPTTAQYRVDCITTGVALRALTSLTPASSIQVILTATDTAIQQQTNVQELKRVTVLANYGGTDNDNETYDFFVNNLSPGVGGG